MAISSRVAGVLGLGAIGLAALVGPSLAQGPDGQVRKANGQGTAPRIGPAVIGTVDMERVFKEYEKVKFTEEQLKGEMLAKREQLMKLEADLKAAAKKLDSLTAGTAEYKKEQAHLTQLQAQLEAERQSAQRDFSQREAEAMATIYKEVQMMVGAIAKSYGLTHVVRTSNEPITGADPNSVMAALARHVVYSDPGCDITYDVYYNLNRRYNAAKGNTGPGASAKPAAGSSAPAPAPPAAGTPKSD